MQTLKTEETLRTVADAGTWMLGGTPTGAWTCLQSHEATTGTLMDLGTLCLTSRGTANARASTTGDGA